MDKYLHSSIIFVIPETSFEKMSLELQMESGHIVGD